MKIKFYSKNHAVLGERTLESAHVPRVGELIYARELLGIPESDPGYFFVTKVIYEASDGGLAPVVSCRQWLQGLRDEELMARRWLPGWTGETIHDDDE